MEFRLQAQSERRREEETFARANGCDFLPGSLHPQIRILHAIEVAGMRLFTGWIGKDSKEHTCLRRFLAPLVAVGDVAVESLPPACSPRRGIFSFCILYSSRRRQFILINGLDMHLRALPSTRPTSKISSERRSYLAARHLD
eukprot:766511-Hanusia_phi.AAC.2